MSIWIMVIGTHVGLIDGRDVVRVGVAGTLSI